MIGNRALESIVSHYYHDGQFQVNRGKVRKRAEWINQIFFTGHAHFHHQVSG